MKWKRACGVMVQKVQRVVVTAGARGHAYGVRVQRVQKVQRVQRVADCRSAAMLIKSALRAYLTVSYDLISILLIGSLRSPPPIRLRRTSPASGGRIKLCKAVLS